MGAWRSGSKAGAAVPPPEPGAVGAAARGGACGSSGGSSGSGGKDLRPSSLGAGGFLTRPQSQVLPALHVLTSGQFMLR